VLSQVFCNRFSKNCLWCKDDSWTSHLQILYRLNSFLVNFLYMHVWVLANEFSLCGSTGFCEWVSSFEVLYS
jgi:hypothetical protein